MVVKVRDNLDQPALERGQVRDSSPVRFCIATPSPHWSASYRGVPRALMALPQSSDPLRLRSVARPIGHAGLRILVLEHRVVKPALTEVGNVAATAHFW
jgi:hypothetical protein